MYSLLNYFSHLYNHTETIDKKQIIDEANQNNDEPIYDEIFLTKNNINYTMTITCNLHTNIDLNKFVKYVNDESIMMAKMNDKFFNKANINMKLDNKIVKFALFKNGQMQFCGCTNDTFNKATKKFVDILMTGTDDYDNGDLIHINFIDDNEKIGIFDTKLQMVFANFKLDYKIDRRIFANILESNNKLSATDTNCEFIDYEYNIHDTAIRFKYYDNNNKINIIVYGSGTILLAGKSIKNIVDGYKYINRILNQFKNNIQVVDSESITENLIDTLQNSNLI